ncbi:MAG: aminotransferase class I/II-fold pyridoxal phosphate-dependent enzyme [Spirochaetales bacterium]|nr:aminotransferase class I/II-fold pyridoxal phosphate-dependent enzyme [Spirochaetales bacterium]
MNPLAIELNKTLQGSVALDLLSDFGKRFFFPKGIVAQTAEAAQHAHKFKATVGMAYENMEPIHLKEIKACIPDLSSEEIFSYAPSAGDAALRKAWLDEMRKKNPSLKDASLSLPIVTTGITNGISTIADLFVDKGDKILIPDLFWGNYRLIFQECNGGVIVSYPFYNAQGGLNIDSIKNAIEAQPKSAKTILLFNFPNNPTGYTPSASEMAQLKKLLVDEAESGRKLLVLSDDSYFGLFFEKETAKESLFALLCDAHENILAVKLDGATKEDFVWGFRIGFITYGSKGLSNEQYDALLKKTTGAIRANISNSNRLGQSLLLYAMKSSDYEKNKNQAFDILNKRYLKVKEILAAHKSDYLKVLPFNSGYFMCFRCEKINAEDLRLYLLYKRGIGTISIGDEYLRIAFSSVEYDDLAELYQEIYDGADELAKQK